MQKFTIELHVANRTATITDNTSKKTYVAIMEPYHRDGRKFIQVNYKKSGVTAAGKGIVQVPRTPAGKFLLKFRSNLDGRKAVSTELSLEEFEEQL